MWSSNAPWSNSGYGVYTRDWLLRAKADGWPIACNTFYGLEGHHIDWEGIRTYPKMNDTWGTDGMFYHGNHFGAQLRICMQDVWPLDRNLLQQMKYWVPYCPIDQDPVPPGVLDALKYAYKIITFSKWGHDALQRAGFTSTLIVEGTDTNVFKPLDKAVCRKEFNIPQDKFVFGMIGANKENPPRKGWQEALEAFKMFHDKHPESVFFFQSNQNYPGGFPIVNYAGYLGIADVVFRLDDYSMTFNQGSEQINKLFNCFDVLLHPSMTEGFGLVVIEAESAGLPVIINDACSMPELVIDGETGLIAKPNRKFFSPSGGFWLMPDAKDIYDKMEQIFTMDRVKMGQKAREFVVENYNIDKLFKEKWIPLMEQLQNEILGPVLTEDKKVVA